MGSHCLFRFVRLQVLLTSTHTTHRLTQSNLQLFFPSFFVLFYSIYSNNLHLVVVVVLLLLSSLKCKNTWTWHTLPLILHLCHCTFQVGEHMLYVVSHSQTISLATTFVLRRRRRRRHCLLLHHFTRCVVWFFPTLDLMCQINCNLIAVQMN